MNQNIHKFDTLETWQHAICKHLSRFSSDANLIVPGGSTPIFLFKKFFNEKRFNQLILSDERITSDKERSNFLTISSLTNSNIFKLCDFPISNHKNISLNKISDALNKIKHPDIALLGLGDDGHYASIFPSTEVIENDKSNNLKIISTKIGDNFEYRITLSEKYIKRTNEILFIAKGKNKYDLINKIENKSEEVINLPIGKLINSYNGKLNIMYCVND